VSIFQFVCCETFEGRTESHFHWHLTKIETIPYRILNIDTLLNIFSGSNFNPRAGENGRDLSKYQKIFGGTPLLSSNAKKGVRVSGRYFCFFGN